MRSGRNTEHSCRPSVVCKGGALWWRHLISAMGMIAVILCGGCNQERREPVTAPPVATPQTSPEPRVGDTPSYIDPSSCSPAAMQVIRSKRLPLQLIHACRDEPVSLDETGRLVTIAYGEPQDCPSGCIYEIYIGLVLDRSGKIVDLPRMPQEHAIWAQRPLNRLRAPGITYKTSLEVQTELGRRSGRYGWVMKFVSNEITVTEPVARDQTIDPKVRTRAYDVVGELFVYLANKREIWDSSGVRMIER